MSRVVYVSTDPGVPVFGRKGASVHVQSLVRELVRRGHEVHLVTARVGGRTPRGLEDVVVHELAPVTGADGAEREASARISAESVLEVLDGLREVGGPDLVMERYALWSDATMRWCAEQGVPSVLEVNAPLIDEQAEHRVLADRDRAESIAERAFGAATSIVCVTPAVADWVAARVSDDRHVHVVANGVDTRRVRPLEVPAAPPAGEFTVGFVGTLKPWHGVEVLVRAFARLADTVTGARLRVVGDGPQREVIRTLVADLGIGDRVDLVGPVDPEEMPRQLAAMDVAVAPYPELADFYFSPLKIYEYLAAGLPVVASAIGEVPELLDDGDLGILVTPGSVAELAAVLAGLASEPAIREDLGRSARRAAVERHDWSCVLDRILATVPEPTTTLADELLGRIA
ncbi:glycosyltransferase family 4 protein [Janibacter corallicola]|uniref:glycosyltransferase family 4 protein n=1 Tax=Janibacter corallicola TaxID=415212 RepID=UPI000833ACE9|nr:glycosyltransferase family 4 protein [Janibacter corallicola]